MAVGATVTWENIDGDDDHTVTSTDGAFNSGVFAPGSDFEHTFDAPRIYPYFCAIHPEMEGTVTVVGDAPAPVASGAAESASPVASSAPAEATATEPAAVSIVELTFEPATIEVDAGATVTWTNDDDGIPHTVTDRDGDFDSGVLQSGDSFSQTFSEPGTYDYFCAIHPSMTGTVVVREPVAPDDIGNASGETTADDVAAVTEVSIVDVAFAPADIEVPVGTTLDWINEDPFAHTVTARDGAFDSGTMDGGDTFSQMFEEPGTYEYFCVIHPSMTGMVTVTP